MCLFVLCLLACLHVCLCLIVQWVEFVCLCVVVCVCVLSCLNGWLSDCLFACMIV